MSRAGRFSVESTSTFADRLSTGGGSEFDNLSDMSEEHDFEDEPQYSSESSFDEGAMSPAVLAEKDESHRLGDEKRMQLDLSKHQELLIDSQKMNQSLKRCLDWTEELIKDGQKALAYKVQASDVKLGGRVLSTEEDLDMGPERERKALLSPWSPSHRDPDLLERASPTGSERADWDSGVDLEGLKLAEAELHDTSLLGPPLGGVSPRSSQVGVDVEEETY